ncbi:MAG: tetratricopeptide repeat protein [bacterium]|nr:tetratricopeptide repeat protein [bacterium]
MKTPSLLIILLMLNHCIYAQGFESYSDEKSYSLADTTLVNKWLDLAHDYRYEFENLDSSQYWAKNALELAYNIQYLNGKKMAHYTLGLNYSTLDEKDSAITSFEETIKLSRDLQDSIWLSKSVQAAGRAYSFTGRYKEALEYYLESLKIRTVRGDSLGMTWPLNNIGTIYFRQQNFDKALEFYTRTYNIEKKLAQPIEQASSLGNIGLVHMNMENYVEALIHLGRSYNILDSLGERCRMTYPTINMGSTFRDLGNLDEALKYYQIAYETSKECEYTETMCTAQYGIGLIYADQGREKLAEEWLIGSYNLAKRLNLKSTLTDITETLYQYYKKKKKYDVALQFLEEYQNLKDDSFNETLTEQLTTLELNYRFEIERDSLAHQNQTELLTLNAELKQQQVLQYLIISGLLVALVFVFILYRNYRLKRSANYLLENKNRIQAEKLALEEVSRKHFENENNKKARSLTAASIQMLALNEKIADLINHLNNSHNLDENGRKLILKELAKLRDSESQWDSLKIHFESVHPYFFERLEQFYHDLSTNDFKLLAFLKMKLSNKEIAVILNVTTGAVEQAKRRLKKKIGMSADETDILAFIDKSIESIHQN